MPQLAVIRPGAILDLGDEHRLGEDYGATIWMGRRDDQDDEIGGRDLAKMDCESVRCKGGIF
ncbi:hypothetical protein [Sinorhizobium meliloti]|uniref:hypothetical protein n=1 Tax=Rhizobium meliloti TaxID=382 RepID=UPI001F377622|nr:hypothetical protein [Sinorhizobium meliloti]